MLFNPEESIDFHGFTGPFIQYTYARTKSILRRELPKSIFSANELEGNNLRVKEKYGDNLFSTEKKMIIELEKYPLIISQAAEEMNPSVIANYVFKLAQSFNSFLTELKVLTAETPEKKN